jgi:acyl-CoA synthetase (NDP forming)
MLTVDYAARRSVVEPDRLRRFFGARSIAVVGASPSSSWAQNLLNALRLGGGVKDVRFVHPKYDEIFGQRTVANLRDLDEPVDMAYIMVGPDRVDPILEDAAAAGIKNAVVLASGYGETGADGQDRQRRLAERAVELDLTIMGPNTIGFINAVDGIAPWPPRPPLCPARSVQSSRAARWRARPTSSRRPMVSDRHCGRPSATPPC